jgi:hypothetical protein
MARSGSFMSIEWLINRCPGDRSHPIDPIILVVKCARTRSAGNPRGTCDVAGAGSGALFWVTAPVLDPTIPDYGIRTREHFPNSAAARKQVATFSGGTSGGMLWIVAKR